MTVTRDFYQVLALPKTATAAEIRARFLELARQRHPDRFTGEERERAESAFQELTEAFNVLANPTLRRQHDQALSKPRKARGSDASRMASFHTEAGQGFLRDENYFAAAESFQNVVHLEPKNADAWYQLARALSHQRKFLEQSLQAIHRACALSPMNADYLKLAGRLNAEAGLPEKAERYYNEALTWGGDDAVVLTALEELKNASKKGKGLFGRGS